MIVAFSHLRWDFVWQRPQQILSRLAAETPVLFVEEPIGGASEDTLHLRLEGPVTVAQPQLRDLPRGPHDSDAGNARIAALLEPLLADERDLTVWYYTPMALGALPAAITPALTVFDAMDDLASFRFAPPQMRAREAHMMREADLVFTGGPTLYRQRQHRHPRVSCFPSGVDRAHFATPRPSAAAAALARIEGPVIGFYSVLDERLDTELVAAIADQRPEWTFALIGPLAKITAADLPVRPNIVHFGMQQYADLPGVLAEFDIAMMPFALNDATRAISPTKTLEFFAGGKPVVSTPVADVVELYRTATHIAATPQEFVAAIEEMLGWGPAEYAAWRTEADRLLAAHDWDQIVAEMSAAMEEQRNSALLLTA
ncbi:MAG: glycosyltransferase [Thermomicrobiales bacterium]